MILSKRIDQYFSSIAQSPTIHEAVQYTSIFLNRPIAVIDASMNHVSHYPEGLTGDNDWDTLVSDGRVRHDYAAITRRNTNQPAPEGALYHCIYSPANELEMEKYRCTLTIGSSRIGGMMVLGDGRPFLEEDMLAMQIAAQTLSDRLQAHFTPLHAPQNAMHRLLRKLLDQPSAEAAADIAGKFPLLANEEKREMVVGFTDPSPGDYALGPFWQRTLSAYFPDVQVIQYNSRLIFFFPPGAPPYDALVSSLSARFDLLGLQVGLSDPFTSILEFKTQVDNARQALHAGAKKDPARALYALREYRLQLMIGRLETSGGHLLCHPAAARLREYDQENGTDYCRILHAYLFHFHNYSLAAKALFMHRNTLTYHVERIRALLGVDLDDPATCYELLISLSMQ